MGLSTDLEFILRVPAYVRNFKGKGNHVWNFSCPICGDSQKRKSKARGYVYRGDNGLLFKCHNCGQAPMGFRWFLKALDDALYKEYVVACAVERAKSRPARPKKTWKEEIRDMNFDRVAKPVDPLEGLPTLDSLPDDHPAKAYILSRKIPNSFLSQLYYAEDFADVVGRWKKNVALVAEPRIVIPFRNKKRLLAIQGRSLEPDAHLRYITIKDDSDVPKLYGLDRVDVKADRIYLLEGPFDSMFLPNAIAMAGADFPKAMPKDRTIVVYDDEPHNAEIVKKMRAAIEAGYTVCIWPRRRQSTDRKDINNMILEGTTPEQIMAIIEENSYRGPIALMMLSKWRRDEQSSEQYRNRRTGNAGIFRSGR